MKSPPQKKRRRRPAPNKPPIQPRPLGSQMVPRVSMVQERLIGSVVVRWSRIEAMLQDVIWALFGVDLAEGRLITARLDVRPKLEMIEALAPRRITDDVLLTQLFEAIDLIQSRHGDRNFIVHGSWGTIVRGPLAGNEHAAMSLREKTEEPGQIVVETFPPGRMREIIRDLQTAQNHLRNVLAALGSSSRTPRAPNPLDAGNPQAGPGPPRQSK